jgi:hypothetical protein
MKACATFFAAVAFPPLSRRSRHSAEIHECKILDYVYKKTCTLKKLLCIKYCETHK